MGSGSSAVAAVKDASDDDLRDALKGLPQEKAELLLKLVEQEQTTGAKELHRKDSKLSVSRNPKDAGWIDVSDINKLLVQPLKIFSAIDGTDCSLCGFQYVVKELMQHDKDSNLHVMHLYDDSKTYLPPKMRREHLESVCDSMCTSNLRGGRFKISVKPRHGTEKAGIRLLEESGKFGADFFVMGFYGRKGRKERSEKMLTSNIMEVIQRGQCSTIAFQMDNEEVIPIGRKVKFVVSVSLNVAATKAFIDALKLSKSGDEIDVVYIKQHDEEVETEGTKLLREKYATLFEGLKDNEERVLSKFGDREVAFHMLKKKKGNTTAETVCEHAEKVDADFVVVGTNALRVKRGKPILGSVSMAIALDCPCNFIVSNYVSVESTSAA